MLTDDAIKHFGSQKKLAEALHELTQPAVAQWGKYPPPLRQLELERVTAGLLKAEPACDKYRLEAA